MLQVNRPVYQQKKSKLTFVKDWCRFVLQYLKITMHQRDPGVIIVNDLPVLEK